MAKYGKTFWSEQLLNALEQMDCNNRLPHGRSYLSNSYIKSICLNEKIKANVKGSMPKLYRVAATTPKFSENQKKQPLKIIQNNNTNKPSKFNYN